MKNFCKFVLFILINNLYAIEFIAHRGLSSQFPENSKEAITESFKYDFSYVEIDVQQTKDNKIVAFHDNTVNRTTKAKGPISNFSLYELQKISKDINSLDEILPLFQNSKVKLIIEIKNNNNKYPGIEERVVSLVKKYQLSNILYKSFSTKTLDRFKKLDNKELIYVVVGQLPWLSIYIDNWIRFGSLTDYKSANYYQIHNFFINNHIVKKIKKQNKKIIAWDVQEMKTLQAMKKLDVDIIETDYPPASFTEKPSLSR